MLKNELAIQTAKKDYARAIIEKRKREEKRKARRMRHRKILYWLVVSFEILMIVIGVGILVGRLFGD